MIIGIYFYCYSLAFNDKLLTTIFMKLIKYSPQDYINQNLSGQYSFGIFLNLSEIGVSLTTRIISGIAMLIIDKTGRLVFLLNSS